MSLRMNYSKMEEDELKPLCKERKIKGVKGKSKVKQVEINTQSEAKQVSAPKFEAKPYIEIGPSIKVDINKTCICCPEGVVAGSLITKEKRQELFGHVAGGSGSHKLEEYQRQKIVDGTGIACPKTNVRINLRTNTLKHISHPNTKSDGFDYSEDFDGCQSVKKNRVYINLKCIVGKGGAQTRSLREVYWFVEGQLRTLHSVENVYFVNVIDGDEAYSTISKFEYLLNLPEFNKVKNSVYVGDLKGYFDWFKNMFGNE